MPKETELKLIDDELRRQVTYAKRRNGLIKKALELYLVCDVDSLFISFSPCGRVSYFYGAERVEEVLARFIELPENIRQLHFTEEEFQEIKGILQELREETYDELLHDRTVQELQQEVDRVKAQLDNLTSEIRNYEPLPESITTVEEAVVAETQLEEVLTKVQERMKELLVNEGNPESQPNDFMTGSEDSPANSLNQAELDDDSDEDQAEMAKQVAVAAESSAVTVPEKDGSPNPFQELAITGSFTSLLLQADQVDQADVPQPRAPITVTLPHPYLKTLFTSVYDNQLKHVQECLLRISNTPKADQTAEVIQSSDNIETADNFIFPAASLPSLDHQLPPQTELGESSDTAAINSPQGGANATNSWETSAFRDLLAHISATKKEPQFYPGFWYMPPPNELYSSAFEMMGLPADPHLRYLEEITGKGAGVNEEQ